MIDSLQGLSNLEAQVSILSFISFTVPKSYSILLVKSRIHKNENCLAFMNSYHEKKINAID